MSDYFVRELEDELVAAARFRARRRSRRIVPPRVPRRRALVGGLAGLAALALAAIVVAFALTRGGDDRAADERSAPPPPSGFVVPIVPMLGAVECGGMDARDEPAAQVMSDFAVLTRAQRADDALMDEVVAALPVGTFDGAETRLAGDRRLRTRLHVVPSLGVPDDASCVSKGPGLCLVVELGGWHRCFRLADVRAGQALTRTPDGLIVGIVPDGIGRVILTAAERTVSAQVVDNVYEAQLDVASGTRVRVRIARPDGCERDVAPELLARVATLRREPQKGFRMPQAALDVLREWEWQLDAIVEDGARFWGGGDGVEFWAVPVVKLGSPDCAPAKHVCVVAVVAEESRADAQCTLGPVREEEDWRLAPLMPGHAAIYGTVPDGVSGALVTIGKRSAEVDAGDNVIGGRLPFPYEDEADVRVELIRRPGQPQPVVGVVDAGGPASDVADRLRERGYATLDTITPGVTPQRPIEVYWHPRLTREEAAIAVAEAVGADDLVRIEKRARTPRPVLDTEAPVIVVVGGG